MIRLGMHVEKFLICKPLKETDFGVTLALSDP